MSARTLDLYLQWNKQNVKELETVLAQLDPDTSAYCRLDGIIAGLKIEGQFLAIDAKDEEKANV